MAHDDMIGIVPTGGQTAEAIAEVAANVARARGLDPNEVTIEHQGDQDVVVVPRATIQVESGRLSTFPPKDAGYSTFGTVELIDAKNPDGRPLAVIDKWQPTVDHR